MPANRENDVLDALDRVVREQRVHLARLARREGLNPEDALDCVHDAFCTFLRLVLDRELPTTSPSMRISSQASWSIRRETSVAVITSRALTTRSTPLSRATTGHPPRPWSPMPRSASASAAA